MKLISVCFCVIGMFCCCVARGTAIVTVTLDNANISGKANDSVDFTGTITNDTPSDYLVVDGTDFLMPNSGDQVGGGFGIEPTDPFGTYSDFVGLDFPADILAPGQSYTGVIGTFQFGSDPADNYPADPALLPAAGDSDAQVPGAAKGDIDISYYLADGDPLNGGNQLGGDSDFLAPATITASVPEPTVTLSLVACACLLSRRRSQV